MASKKSNVLLKFHGSSLPATRRFFALVSATPKWQTPADLTTTRAPCYVHRLPCGHCAQCTAWGLPLAAAVHSQNEPEENRHPGGPAAQPEEHPPGNPSQHSHGGHRAFRFGQVLARIRYSLRRGTTSVRRIAFGLRQAVPWPD